MATLLRVYYGFYKLNKVAKRPGLAIYYVNDKCPSRFSKDGYDGVSRFIHVAFSRYQLDKEVEDARMSNRLYSVYSLFFDDPHFHNSLDAVLLENRLAESSYLSESILNNIENSLRDSFHTLYPNYKENGGYQYSISF